MWQRVIHGLSLWTRTTCALGTVVAHQGISKARFCLTVSVTVRFSSYLSKLTRKGHAKSHYTHVPANVFVHAWSSLDHYVAQCVAQCRCTSAKSIESIGGSRMVVPWRRWLGARPAAKRSRVQAGSCILDARTVRRCHCCHKQNSVNREQCVTRSEANQAVASPVAERTQKRIVLEESSGYTPAHRQARKASERCVAWKA